MSNGVCSVNFKASSGGSLIGSTYNITDIDIGRPVFWANDIWICVHMSSSMYYLAALSIYCMTEFGPTTDYADSVLNTLCTQVENVIPKDSLDLAVPVTISGHSSKIFVASYAQLNTQFDYFSEHAKRVCNSVEYWTCSKQSNGAIYYVSSEGSFNGVLSPSTVYGFRPFVALKRN